MGLGEGTSLFPDWLRHFPLDMIRIFVLILGSEISGIGCNQGSGVAYDTHQLRSVSQGVLQLNNKRAFTKHFSTSVSPKIQRGDQLDRPYNNAH